MPHIGFVGFEINSFAAGFSDDFAEISVVFDGFFDAIDVGGAVACGFEFVGDVGVGADESGDGFVEGDALGFATTEIVGNFSIAAEVLDVFEVASGRLDTFAEECDGFEGIVKPIASFRQAVLEENLGVGIGIVAGVEFGGVDGDRVFDFFEEVFVINDVTKILVVAIKTVDAADGLEQAMVLHPFVDVQHGAAWSVESGKEFVYND